MTLLEASLALLFSRPLSFSLGADLPPDSSKQNHRRRRRSVQAGAGCATLRYSEVRFQHIPNYALESRLRETIIIHVHSVQLTVCKKNGVLTPFFEQSEAERN